MTAIDVLGAGAFGTSLAIALARDGRVVTLWGRNPSEMEKMRTSRVATRLSGVEVPSGVMVTADLTGCTAPVLLLCMPMQSLGAFLAANRNRLGGKTLVACCKGIDMATGRGPTALITECVPEASPAVLTGPSFAADIARGLPTALTVASTDPALAKLLQHDLSTPSLRLYRSTDPVGAELGGALKNVVALAAGFVIGRRFGDSARAAIMTRGFVEMQRFAAHRGADGATLYGLSGFGDLVLTCTSELSRNFAHGLAVGQGGSLDTAKTVEGIATSHAVAAIARDANLDMPITLMVSAVLDGSLTINEATETLMSRALREE